MRIKNKSDDSLGSYRIPMAVTIPAGKCPVKLEGADKESIREWITSLIDLKPKGYGYEPTVFKYYSRQFYDFGKDEYKQICNNVDLLLHGKTIFYKGELPF